VLSQVEVRSFIEEDLLFRTAGSICDGPLLQGNVTLMLESVA
jgi:hypothetical protein